MLDISDKDVIQTSIYLNNVMLTRIIKDDVVMFSSGAAITDSQLPYAVVPGYKIPYVFKS